MKKLVALSVLLFLMSFSWVAEAAVTLHLRNQTGAATELHVHYQANGLPHQFWGVFTDKLLTTSILSGTNITINGAFVIVVTDNSGYGLAVDCYPTSSAFVNKDPAQVIYNVTSTRTSYRCAASNV